MYRGMPVLCIIGVHMVAKVAPCGFLSCTRVQVWPVVGAYDLLNDLLDCHSGIHD